MLDNYSMKFKDKQSRQATEMVGRPPSGNTKKDKNIKVTADVHHQLGEIGKLNEDFGDAVARILQDHYTLKKLKAWCATEGIRIPEEFGDK